MVRRIQIQAKPGSKKSNIEEISDEEWIVRIQARPIEGAANKAIQEAIAKHLKIAKSKVRIVRGESSRIKLFEVDSDDNVK